MHRLAVVVAVLTWLLVIAGGMVTSNDAAGSIPDWPLAWGRLIPPLEGGIRYEFAHRSLALTVGVSTFLMALRLGTRLAWAAFYLVLAQALVGGIGVLLVLPKTLVIIHACLAQLCFGAVVALCSTLDRPAGLSGGGKPAYPVVVILAALALFAQTILGAAVRYQLMGPIPHIAGAAIATACVMWASVPVMLRHMREAGALLGLTALQLFLGVGAYAARTMEAPQPESFMVLFTVAHVAIGSLAFGAAIALAFAVYWQPYPDSGLEGGIAIA